MKNDESIKEIWQAVKLGLKDAFPAFAYDLWVPSLELSSIDESRAVLSCRSATKYKIIKNRHIDTISHVFGEVLGYPVAVDIILDEEEDKEEEKKPEPEHVCARE